MNQEAFPKACVPDHSPLPGGAAPGACRAEVPLAPGLDRRCWKERQGTPEQRRHVSVCELREVGRGRAALGRRELGQAASPEATQEKGGREHPATPACGLDARSVPEPPGLLPAIPDSLPASVSLPRSLALIASSQPQPPLHQAQAKAFIPKPVQDRGVPGGWGVLRG